MPARVSRPRPRIVVRSSMAGSPCHGRLNMVREPDAHNHGAHNDTLGAVMDIGFGSFLYSATVALNIHILPWNDGPFGQKIIQAADIFRKFISSSHLASQNHWSREGLVWTRDCIRQLRTHCLESVSGIRVCPQERAGSGHVQVVPSVLVFARAL